MKLLILCLAHVLQGRRPVYRRVRRLLGTTRRYVEQAPPALRRFESARRRSLLLYNGVHSLLSSVGKASLERSDYFRNLPLEVRAAWSLGQGLVVRRSQREFDRWVTEKASTERKIVDNFGSRALIGMQLLWENEGSAPRFLDVTVVCARDLPSMVSASRASAAAAGEGAGAEGAEEEDSSFYASRHSTDAYCVLCLVPPPPESRAGRTGADVALGDLYAAKVRRERDKELLLRGSSAGGGAGGAPRAQFSTKRAKAASVAFTGAPSDPRPRAASAEESLRYSPPLKASSATDVRQSPSSARPATTNDDVLREAGASGASPSTTPAMPPLSLPQRQSSNDSSAPSTPRRWHTSLAARALAASAEVGPEQPRGAYAYAVSKVKRSTTAPQWAQRFEMELEGGAINRDGCFSCPDAALTALRLEVWHRLPWSVDAFLGEVTVPLVHLMDLQPRETWYALGDPQGKADLPAGAAVEGHVFLNLQFTTM